MTTPSERIPKLLDALNALLASIPRDVHDGTMPGCATCAAITATETAARDALSELLYAVTAAHVDGEGYIAGCSVCEALRAAEHALQEVSA